MTRRLACDDNRWRAAVVDEAPPLQLRPTMRGEWILDDDTRRVQADKGSFRMLAGGAAVFGGAFVTLLGLLVGGSTPTSGVFLIGYAGMVLGVLGFWHGYSVWRTSNATLDGP